MKISDRHYIAIPLFPMVAQGYSRLLKVTQGYPRSIWISVTDITLISQCSLWLPKVAMFPKVPQSSKSLHAVLRMCNVHKNIKMCTICTKLHKHIHPFIFIFKLSKKNSFLLVTVCQTKSLLKTYWPIILNFLIVPSNEIN